MKFEEINNYDSSKIKHIACKVISIAKTSGPVVITLFDGTKHISLRYRNSDMIDNLNQGDFINAKLKIINKEKSEFLGFELLDANKAKNLQETIQSKLKIRSEPNDCSFMIESKVLDGLRPHMNAAARKIKQAVISGEQILIKHHADCDGYSAAYILEQAIQSIAHDKNQVRCIPSRPPFNDYRDISRDIASNNGKKTLFISLDNGSTEQDVLAFKKLKAYGFSIIVVDHHLPTRDAKGNAVVDDYVDVHINSHLQGGGSNFSAGMLSAELARFVGDVNLDLAKQVCALSGVADRCEGKEFEMYLEGFDKKHLMDLAECIDFEANYAASSFMHDILGHMQKSLMEIILPEINSRKKMQLDCALKYCYREQRKKVLIIRFDVNKISIRGEFPKQGKITGMLKDYFENKGKTVIVFGISDNHVSLRTNIKGFSINEFISNMKSKMPYAMIDGGGHDVAGSIAFAGAAKEELISELYRYTKDMVEKLK